MPNWTDRLRDTLREVTERAAGAANRTVASVTAVTIRKWVTALVDALAAGDKNKAREWCGHLRSVMAAAEIAKSALLGALARGDAKLTGRTLAFVLDEGLGTPEAVADLLATLDAVPCRALAAAVAGRSASEVRAVLARLLRIPGAAADKAVDLLISILKDAGTLDLPGLLRFLEPLGEGLLERFVARLVAAGAASLAAPQGLLDAAAGEPPEAEAVTRLFGRVVAALARLANSAALAGAFGGALAAWLAAGPEAPAIPGGVPFTSHLSGEAPGERVPVRVALVSAGLTEFAGAAPASQAAALPLLRAFVDALRNLGQTGETLLVWLTRAPVLFVILLPALIAVAVAIPMRFMEWIGQDVEELREHDRRLKIKVLPAPSEASTGQRRRYMIFSDLHRDTRRDVVMPRLFDVSHFTSNRDLYLRALRYCRDNDYTVIENGDCEELWYRPQITDDPAVRASEILSHHASVYDILRGLHRQGRYFRTRGNHDNWWMLAPGRMATLAQAMAEPGAPPFEIWDGLVIPEVRSMELDLPEVDWSNDEAALLHELFQYLPIGLSPLRYRARCPMFILHGHQVDFWNCDEHHFVGLVITNAVGVPADGVDALPYYLKGIDVAGNPWLKFADWFQSRSPWDNWIPDDASKILARRIEIMDERERRLQDSVSFSETLAASLSLALDYQPGPARDFCKLPGAKVQIVMGHTHNPQSRPYLNFTAPPGSLAPDPVKELLRWTKVSYFNSGTGGWWEGILWAIEVTDDGQPRLVYWDRESCEPHTMTWELHNRDVPTEAELRALITRFKAMLATLPSATSAAPVPAPPTAAGIVAPWEALTGSMNLDLSDADDLRQHAGAAWLQLLQLKAAVCGGRIPEAAVTLQVDLGRLPVAPRGPGVLAGTLSRPEGSLREFVAAWLRALGWTSRSGAPLSAAGSDAVRQLSIVLLLAAYLFRSSLCHTLGLTLYLAASRGAPLEIGWDGAKLKVRLAVG